MRTAEINRKTNETDIYVSLNLDGEGQSEINTGIGFFDHMLTALAKHARIDLVLRCQGDLQVDAHHTVEDCGIVLGKAIAGCLCNKENIARYGHAFVPMDESLGFCALDISGRAYLVFECPFTYAKMGSMDTQLVEEFFRAICVQAGITCHLKLQYGINDHHKCEAMFKAFAHSLRLAVTLSGNSVLSTKGLLDG